MLAIRLSPPARLSFAELGIDIDGKRQNWSNGICAQHSERLPSPEAALPTIILEESDAADGWESREVRAGLVRASEHSQEQSERLDFPELSIDPATREVEVGGLEVELTKIEFDLLYFLARHQRHIFTRSQLLDYVWGDDYYGYESTVTVHISRLRRKLNRNVCDIDLIQTVWGVGYKFEPPGSGMHQ